MVLLPPPFSWTSKPLEVRFAMNNPRLSPTGVRKTRYGDVVEMSQTRRTLEDIFYETVHEGEVEEGTAITLPTPTSEMKQ